MTLLGTTWATTGRVGQEEKAQLLGRQPDGGLWRGEAWPPTWLQGIDPAFAGLEASEKKPRGSVSVSPGQGTRPKAFLFLGSSEKKRKNREGEEEKKGGRERGRGKERDYLKSTGVVVHC